MLIPKTLVALAWALVFGLAIGLPFGWGFSQFHQSSETPPQQRAAINTADQTTKGEAAPDTAKKSADERIADYTWWLAIFTGLLVFVTGTQIAFLIRADKITRITADAAKLSADSITRLERPYIFIWNLKGTEPEPFNARGTTLYANPLFTYSVSNKGKFAAVVESVSIACGHEWNGLFPPLEGIADHKLMQEPIFSANLDVHDFSHKADWAKMNVPSRDGTFHEGLIFRVVIKYRSAFTKRHETSQCWKCTRVIGTPGFYEVSDERYTYMR